MRRCGALHPRGEQRREAPAAARLHACCASPFLHPARHTTAKRFRLQESLPNTVALQMLLGLQYPQAAAALGFAWCAGRIVYTIGGLFDARCCAASRGLSGSSFPPACRLPCCTHSRANQGPSDPTPPPLLPAGYSTGDPQARRPGSAVSGLAYLAMILATAAVGVKTALGM